MTHKINGDPVLVHNVENSPLLPADRQVSVGMCVSEGGQGILFHANCLNACDTPLAFGGAPTGSIMYKLCSSLLPGDKVLVIA